jgi:gliding motility-associated-like protein
MNKAPLLSLKAVIFFLSVNAAITSCFAQTPAKCLEIESILVDACVPGGGCTSAGSPSCNCEGKNEMVRFKIGPAAINTADLTITWPNNSFLGISPANATTAALVSSLNATILSCGHLVEPTAGLLPAGKTILLITSTEMCTTANSFANLSDTIYVIFQNAGNFQGHFANYSTPSGLRTTIFKQISTGCADTVVYDKALLINQSGGYGGSSALNDGSTVEFSWPGVQTYVNHGCQAPFLTITANAGTGGNICAAGTISLAGSESGNYSGIIWQGGQGTFSTPDTLTTNYTAAPTESGTITLTMGVIGFCTDTVFSSVNVTINPLPVASIGAGGSTTICAGSSVTLTASGGTSYSWSTGSSATSITASTAGTYTLTAINTCGSDTATQLVNLTPLPAITITNSGSSALCPGDTTILVAAGIGNYVWSTSSTNDSLIVTSGGTYSVTATNSCGTASDAITITNSALPNPVITPGGSTTICPGDSVSLIASGGSTYSWSTGSTASSIFVSAAGTYTLTATNTCGSLQTTQSIAVSATPAVAINSAATSFCTGSNLLLWATGGGSYLWTGGSVNDSITVTSGGSYTVTTSSSCGTASDNIIVTQLPLPIAAITTSGTTTICAGASVTLFASGGTSYLWQPVGSPATSISAGIAGTYTLTASNGCGSDTATIIVTTINPPNAAITPAGSTTICQGNTVTLNASGGTSYVWSNGQTGNSINVGTEGTYWLVASNTCGNDTSIINVNVDSVMALFTGDVYTGLYPLTVNFSNNSSASATGYAWNFGDGHTSGLATTTNTFQVPGTYTVTLTVTNANGCTDTYTVTIIVLDEPSALEVPNVFTPNSDLSNDFFGVIASGITEFDCVIYDRWGLKMTELLTVTNTWDGRTDAGVNASDGTYYYIIKAKGGDGKEYDKKGFIQLIR